MRRTLAATSWIVPCVFFVSLAAQDPQPPTGQPPPQAQKADAKEVTLTGCLATGDQPNTFKLTNIGVAEKATIQPGEVVGTTGVKAGEALQLIGVDAEKIKAHVGHTVAVTGMLAPPKEGQTAAPPPAARTEAPGMERRLNVKSFKHVDATCPPAAK